MVPKLQVDVEVVRPELAVVLRLAGVEDVQRVDDVLVAGIELRQVEAVGDRQSSASSTSRLLT